MILPTAIPDLRAPSWTALLLAATCLGGWWGVTPSAAGEEVPPAAYVFDDTTSVRWVLVPTVVRGRSGFVHGLERDDFRLWVDRRQIPIQSFDASQDGAIRLVYLQDLSGSMANSGKLELSRFIARRLLDRARSGDEIALASFTSGQVRVDGRSDDGLFDGLLPVVDGWVGYGTTSLHDAVAFLPEIDLVARQRRGAAVLVTDGTDNASVLDPEAVRRRIRQAEVPVYVFDLGAGSSADGGGGQVLQLLASATGGRHFAVRSLTDAALACARVLEELRGQYLLGFPVDGQGGEQHSIRVETRKGLDVFHRAGYRGAGPRPGGPGPSP